MLFLFSEVGENDAPTGIRRASYLRIHAAQPHRGATPRFMAQPPLYLRTPLELNRRDGDYSLVEKAIRL